MNVDAFAENFSHRPAHVLDGRVGSRRWRNFALEVHLWEPKSKTLIAEIEMQAQLRARTNIAVLNRARDALR